jgi:hypothetical protein
MAETEDKTWAIEARRRRLWRWSRFAINALWAVPLCLVLLVAVGRSVELGIWFKFTSISAIIGATVWVLDSASPWNITDFNTIRCRQLLVVDDAGRVRFRATTLDGFASIALVDKDEGGGLYASSLANGSTSIDLRKNGTSRIYAMASADGVACINLNDKAGTSRISSAAHSDGDASVTLRDHRATVRIVAVTRADGEAAIRVLDSDQMVRISSKAETDGDAGISIFDHEGRSRIATGIRRDGDAAVVLRDKCGNARIVTNTNADGDAEIALYDNTETSRIVAAAYADGNAGLGLLDKVSRLRISSVTRADGTIRLPTEDQHPE